MSSSAGASYVLERMHVRDLPRAYVLGCHAPRVTVLSQQFRAFNLIWALFEKGRLKPGDRVGVIGGGIGGLTAAAAAMIKGCSVVLTEERQQLMHLQRGNTTRLLHPNIYEWPSVGSEDIATRFPCMNWTADLAGQVVARLDLEWERLETEHQPQIHTRTRITAVKPEGSDGRLVLCKDDEWMSDPCDVVILAVGFGVEPPEPGLHLDSYWENDSLEQSTRGRQEVRRVLVSGLGDGGCIDVLRLMYTNFQHTKFADAVARHQNLHQYKPRLRAIDRDMPIDHREKYLREQYTKLDLPPNLAESLGTLRTDTLVVVNSPDPTSPLSPDACILHRVAVWALIIGNKITYKPGRIDKKLIEKKAVASGIKYYVPFEGSGRFGFDALVIRHGPAPCLVSFPEIACGYSGITETAPMDKTRRKLYPDGFFPAKPISPNASRQDDHRFFYSQSEGSPPKDGATIPPPSKFSAEFLGSAKLNPLDYSASAANLANIESLTRRLKAETLAENYVPAVEASNSLDAILIGCETELPPDLWLHSHQVLFDFELLARKRIQSGGGSYDLGRLHDLVRRMRLGYK